MLTERRICLLLNVVLYKITTGILTVNSKHMTDNEVSWLTSLQEMQGCYYTHSILCSRDEEAC